MTRRDFLVRSTATTATLLVPPFVFSQDRPSLRVGLVGCGGRGTGAMLDHFHADPGVVAYAMGDVFPDRLRGARETCQREMKERYQVTDDRAFTGLDAYQKVIASGVDIVILATPPGFRPAHLKAAIEAGKHVFMEKPVAVDVPGIKTVYAAADLATQKKLSIVAGTQRRHDRAYRQAMEKIHGGAMGELVACYAYWNQGGLWNVARGDNMGDVEWQLRNWLYFSWLSGDHIVEQHVHNMDVCNWAMQKRPVKAISLAGRQVRTDPAYGHIYDHFATEFEYDNGVKMLSMCRQIDGTAARVEERLVGTKGTSNANTSIRGENPWRFEGDRPNPYVEEHKNLLAAIRSGNPINEGRQVADSTMTAILGRLAGYTGQEVTWDKAMESTEVLMPAGLTMDAKLEVAPIAVPGRTKLT